MHAIDNKDIFLAFYKNGEKKLTKISKSQL